MGYPHHTLKEAPQVPFLMCTLEIPQTFASQVLALNLLLFLLASFLLKLRFSQTKLFSNEHLSQL